MARPKISIDYETVEKLSMAHCTQEEIATFLEIHVRTLQRDNEFCRIYKKGIDHGRMSLRRKQMQLALQGNTTMLVWLGKQLLGQTDRTETEHSGGTQVEIIYGNKKKKNQSKCE